VLEGLAIRYFRVYLSKAHPESTAHFTCCSLPPDVWPSIRYFRSSAVQVPISSLYCHFSRNIYQKFVPQASAEWLNVSIGT